MSLFSFLRKNKQESASEDSAFYSRAEEESNAVRNRNRRRSGSGGGRDKEPMDPVLPEKKRARRRLIGAIALVLAAIIGLPMVLDSEPKPLADDIAIQIPSKDKPSSSARPSPEKQQATPSAGAGISAEASLDPKEEVIETPTAAPAEDKSSSQTAAAGSRPAEPPVAPSAAATKANQAAKSNEPIKSAAVDKSVGAHPPLKSESKTEPKAAEKAVKADKAVKPEKAEKPDDSARAMALLEGKSEPNATTKNKPEKFVIQVAALSTKEKVNEVQAKLKDAGIKSYTQKIATESGDRIRIRVGPFESKEEADKVRAKLGKLGMNGTLVPA